MKGKKASKARGKILCLCVGNAYRRDDGVGLVIARELMALNLPHLVVMEAAGDGAALMDQWAGAETVILIDAVSSGRDPGTIYQLDANEQVIPTEFFKYSTHAFSVGEAVELARALGHLPRRMVVYGIEGRDFSVGEGLSPEVAEAVHEVVDRVVQIAELVPHP